MTSYDATGAVQAMTVGSSTASTTAHVSFRLLPDRPPQEAATMAARCVVQQQPDSSSGAESADLLRESNLVEILYHHQVSNCRGPTSCIYQHDTDLFSKPILWLCLPSTKRKQDLWPSSHEAACCLCLSSPETA